MYMCAQSFQSCPTLCDPVDHGPPGSSVHGIFQARVLEWVAIAFSEATILLCQLSSLISLPALKFLSLVFCGLGNNETKLVRMVLETRE